MAHITAQNELAATYAVEFESKLHFRVEIYRVVTDQAVQSTIYFSEVYHLRLPHGLSANPFSIRGLNRFRPFLHFLEDFESERGCSVDAVRADTLLRLSDYADAYLKEFPDSKWRQRNH